MKKILSMLISVSIALSTILGLMPIIGAESTVVLRGTIGWLEAAAVYFDLPDGSYDGANVYYKKSDASSFTKIDDELVRKYDGFWRADILGLAKGTYQLKVVAAKGGVETETTAAITEDVSVLPHDRTGYAFADGNVPGAYNKDGTLKANAEVVYISKDNTEALANYAKGGGDMEYGSNPVVIRILGFIPKGNIPSSATGSTGMIEFKSKAKSFPKSPGITIEGVGRDAALNVGISIKNNSHIELRNFAIVNFDDDATGMESKNKYIWIHNMDYFYGAKGGTSDQKKGDGTIDIKTSQNITVSYTHFWDTGKTHLLANGTSDDADLITYANNWYDHSDSRHPRVRSANAHIYNNYYLGISKYGIGAAYRSKGLFVESNVFEKTNRPMTISMQGNDDGTFSKEDGGIIKAYNNFLVDIISKAKYSPYDAVKNPVEFDAYEVKTRDEQIPSNITTNGKGSGGAKTFYNNFDTTGSTATTGTYFDSNWPLLEKQDEIKERVMKYAGRMQGGNIAFEFGPNDYSLSDEKMPALEALLDTYEYTGIGNLKDSPDAAIVRPEVKELKGERTGENSASIEFTPMADGTYWYLMSKAETSDSITIEDVKKGVTGTAINGAMVTSDVAPEDTDSVRVFVVIQNQQGGKLVDSRIYTINVPKYDDPTIPNIVAVSGNRVNGYEGETKATVTFNATRAIAGKAHYIVQKSTETAPTKEEVIASTNTVEIPEAGGNVSFDVMVDSECHVVYIVQANAENTKYSEMINITISKFLKLGEATVYNFSDDKYASIELPTNRNGFPYTDIEGITITAKSNSDTVPKFIDRNRTVDGYTFTRAFCTNGASEATGIRQLQFTTFAPGLVEIYADTGTAGRSITLWKTSGASIEPIEGSSGLDTTNANKITYQLDEAGTYGFGCTQAAYSFTEYLLKTF